jgi:anti-anti-sigma factor
MDSQTKRSVIILAPDLQTIQGGTAFKKGASMLKKPTPGSNLADDKTELDSKIFETEQIGNTIILIPIRNLRELDYKEIEEGASEVLALLERRHINNVVLDFSRTDYYGSTALGFFLKLWKRVKTQHGHMAFCNVSPHEMEILRITKLDEFWPICASRQEAMRVINQATKAS